MNPRTRNRLYILSAALLFSTGGAAIKSASFVALQVAGYRSAIAAVALVVFVPASRRGWSLRVLPAAAAYAATLVLFVSANKLTTGANAIFLQSTAPLYILLLGPLLLHERARRSDLIFAAAVGLGLALFFAGSEPALASAPNPFLGNTLGALSGVAWALTVISLRWLGQHGGVEGAISSVVAGNVLAFLVCAPAALPVPQARPSDWLAIAYLGVFQVGLAYFLLARGLRGVSAFEASTLVLLEPVLNPFWTWLMHGERPSAWANVGGLLILSATFLHTWRERHANPGRPGPEDAAGVSPPNVSPP